MSDQVLIPKMKRVEKTQKKYRIPWLNIALIIFCTLLIICSTFLNVNIKHYIIPQNIFSGEKLYAENFVYSMYFIPQIPIIMFICSLLGKRPAITCTIFYILLGLIAIPVFALGGGYHYLGEFGFGYILGYIPAIVLAGNCLGDEYSFIDMIKATILGVLTIHIIGIFYMIIVVLFKHAGGDFISGWIYAQSGLKIIYDIVISFVLILVGKYLHKGLTYILE